MTVEHARDGEPVVERVRAVDATGIDLIPGLSPEPRGCGAPRGVLDGRDAMRRATAHETWTPPGLAPTLRSATGGAGPIPALRRTGGTSARGLSAVSGKARGRGDTVTPPGPVSSREGHWDTRAR